LDDEVLRGLRSGSRRSDGPDRSTDAGPAARLLELQRTAGNRAVASAIAQAPAVQREVDDEHARPGASGAGDAATATPPRRVTGYVGLNPLATREAEGLRKRGRGETLVSLNDPAAEKKYQSNPEIFDFVVDELGIDLGDFARWDKATDILMNADPHLREQLADLMRWFNKAQNGELILERLILSGHSNGVELWGEYEEGAESKPGTMLIERDLGTFGAVFPRAVEQVEDVMFSACFSINAVEIVRKIFPNLRTVWSYGGFSPSAANGAVEHIITWERATEGQKTLHKGLKRGSNALWTREKGYIVGDPAAAAAGPLYAETVRGWRELGEPYYDGTKEVAKSRLDAYYLVVQRLIAHPGAAEDLKDKARKVRDVVLRLRFWPLVTKRFGSEHGEKLRPAYDHLGLQAPNWESLTRTGLKAHVEAVKKAIEEHGDGGHGATIDAYLKKGLYGLDPQVIKPDWL
jgi:hypothetical protein